MHDKFSSLELWLFEFVKIIFHFTRTLENVIKIPLFVHLRMKPSSQPVHLPVRRGQLTREQQQHKDMQDTVKEFSFGALGTVCFTLLVVLTALLLDIVDNSII